MEMGRLIGRSAPTVFKWETGAILPPVSAIASIREATGLTIRKIRPDLFVGPK